MKITVNEKNYGVVEFYDAIAKQLGKDPEKCSYDCRKINVARNIYAGSYSYEDIEYDYGYYLIEYVNADGATEWYDTDAFTKEEAVGRFLMSHPDISYGDVVDVCVDKEVYRYC